MNDRRGTYVSLPVHEASYSDSSTDYHSGKPFALLSGRLFALCRRFRGLLLLGGVAAVLLTFAFHQHNVSTAWVESGPYGSLDAVHLDRLASPLTGYNSSNVGTKTFIVGEHHRVSGNYPDDYQWIDHDTRKPFNEVMRRNGMNNNAMGKMPAGSPYDVLVVARGWNDKYVDATEKIEYVNLTIVGFFANYDAEKGQWRRSGPEPYVLDLPIWRQMPRPCPDLVNGGPADPRFLWSDAGEPLAVIGTTSRVAGVCKAVGLVDLRAVWPALKDHLEHIGYGDIPIKFDTFTEVGKAGKKERFEKNWAPFFPGPKPSAQKSSWLPSFSTSGQKRLEDSTWPLFTSQIADRTVLAVNSALDTSERSPDSYVLAEKIDLSMHVSNTTLNADESCLTRSLPQSWHPSKLHQATPFYRVTFCDRGTCVPSTRNTVLLGLIHYKIDYRRYRRMFVTMSTEAPYQFLSVSPPLHFGSVASDNNIVFSVSMAFMSTENKTKRTADNAPFRESLDAPGGYLGHGWLDDTIVIGAGLRDAEYDSIHLPLADALRGHNLCYSGL